MNLEDMESVAHFTLLYLFLGILVTTVLSSFFFYLGWKLTNAQASYSPYAKDRLILGEQLTYEAISRLEQFMMEFSQVENAFFDPLKASICPLTGRLFPNSLNWMGVPRVKWNFLQKRCLGSFMSWGSLSPREQESIRQVHKSLEGFQLAKSCPLASPAAVTEEYARSIPGPLYVDVATRTLLGWKCVPNSSLEVLIIQRPERILS